MESARPVHEPVKCVLVFMTLSEAKGVLSEVKTNERTISPRHVGQLVTEF